MPLFMALFGKLRKQPGRGRKFIFHGSFDHKKDAVKREREVRGFIIERHIEGKKRYFVLTAR